MRTAEARPTLILMLKDPSPGRVKTRLGRDIGMISAAWWFRHQTRKLIRQISDARWRTVLALAPDRAAQMSRAWSGHLQKWPQGAGDLGERMEQALSRAMPGPALLIGGDIPGITRSVISNTFRALQGNDVVLGPAPDGGFWGIGVSGPQLPRGLFKDVRWSSAHALADTLDGLKDCRVALSDTLSDVDTIADLAPGVIHATPLTIR